MSPVSPEMHPGQKVFHPELGEGVVVGLDLSGYISVFFRAVGERKVSRDSLSGGLDRYDLLVNGIAQANPDRLERLWLSIEAEEIPLTESAATLTSAKVELLPHQVVLTHRVANTNPKRFLIADEVGLGKTIETALILRELASRGEMQRAIMVVPAGLVENWRHELNDIFSLDFEVFGSEGDVTDRKTNAFAKHDRLIVSIDTLKRKSRVKRLLEAPTWDLVVFDEAHHLSVYRNGSRVKKTDNFRLAESLKDHCRDLLLLSATPHQGNHFRFWMLIRLLSEELFEDAEDMVFNRHRLNAVVIRRTKADACSQDGGPLFTRRIVHTESFNLSEPERQFYDKLLGYLRDGYDLASQKGSKCRALGFVMTIFQKIAASSFAAIRATLMRRLLMLTLQEAIDRNELLDVDGRNHAMEEAKDIVHEINNLPFDPISNAQVDQILAEAKFKLLKKRQDTETFLEQVTIYSDTELIAADNEESAALMVAITLPEERKRIRNLLELFPSTIETKCAALVKALGLIWQHSPNEKIVIFATYLGTVEIIKKYLDDSFPGKGIDILKGGDHGTKTAVQKRFRRKDGPQVLVCTAAGREGINLQHAHILFNYDLPWNPMDLEQRIGRIHRYGQQQTAQVYNLVAADTIEGKIFLLLEDKLNDIAQALGKVDKHGQVTEDFRTQILGQLSSSISYDSLYKEALSDPTLRRTQQELEVAMTNADLARKVVFELFQDLDRFNLGDYRRFDDAGQGMDRLVAFITRAARMSGLECRKIDDSLWALNHDSNTPVRFTSERDRAIQEDTVELFGLEHPIIKKYMSGYSDIPLDQRFVVGRLSNVVSGGLLTFWKIGTRSNNGSAKQHIVRIGMTPNGDRAPWLERLDEEILGLKPSSSSDLTKWQELAMQQKKPLIEMLHREIRHSGIVNDEMSFSETLLAIIGINEPVQ